MTSNETEGKPTPSAKDIERWLVKQLSERLRVDAASVDPQAPLTRYGIDSAEAASLSYELETWLGREIFPSDIIGAGSIESLAERLEIMARAREQTEEREEGEA